jgi:hypothetical protein
MKKLTYSILIGAIAASSALAGDHVVSSGKETKAVIPPAEPCFRDHEFQLDVFGTYTNSLRNLQYQDGFGGGIGVNYFFTRYIGVGVDGSVYDGDVSGVWNTTGSIIARLPIENSICIAPYIYGGGGVRMDGATVGTVHAGGGLEWRVSHDIGIFSDVRYTWAEHQQDALQTRVGIRFVF